MKEYLQTCRSAQELRLLRKLDLRQHFVEDSEVFSLQDLKDINQGVLVPFLQDVHGEFETHIKKNCEVLVLFALMIAQHITFCIDQFIFTQESEFL